MARGVPRQVSDGGIDYEECWCRGAWPRTAVLVGVYVYAVGVLR